MDKIIIVDHVSKSFQGTKVLNDVSVSFERGKIHGIVGRNGSGKTVLIKTICGFMKPDTGKVIVDGKVVGKDMDFPQNIGAIIEAPGFLPTQSAYKNLMYLASLRGIIGKKEVRYAIDLVGLNSDDKKPVGKYSLGMKQRLGIAMALLGKPQLLILDEPTNGLDPAGIQEIRELIKGLPATHNMTVIVSSHLLSEVEQMADMVGIIHHGEMLFQGNMNELATQGSSLEEVFLAMTGGASEL